MQIEPVTLDGHHVRLEPVSLAHVPALWRAAEPKEIRRYLSSTVRSEEEMRGYAPRTNDARRVVADDRITRPAHTIMTASSDNSRRTTP